jgi:hypothetical protein
MLLELLVSFCLAERVPWNHYIVRMKATEKVRGSGKFYSVSTVGHVAAFLHVLSSRTPFSLLITHNSLERTSIFTQ